MPEITLIPKEEKPEFKISFQKVIFYLPIVLFAITFLVYLGFFFYNYSLNKSIKSVQAEIDVVESQRDLKEDSEFIDRIFNLGMRINNLKRVLNIQAHPTEAFSLLEKLTLPKTRYFNFSCDFSGGVINLRGETDGYANLIKQMLVFLKSPEVKDAKFSGIGLSPGGKVSFGLELKFDKDILFVK